VIALGFNPRTRIVYRQSRGATTCVQKDVASRPSTTKSKQMPSTHHGILIHVVFSTKQRFNLLHRDWRDELYAMMGGIAKEHKSVLLRAGGIEDHVHLMLKIHPSFAIADTIKLIKGNSSRWININHKVSARFEWQRGYGAFSVSESMSDAVKSYIENQEKHHRQQSFEDEYFEILRKHKIEFDKRYVFDDEIVA